MDMPMPATLNMMPISRQRTVNPLSRRGETVGGPNICPYCNKAWILKDLNI